MKEKLAYCLLNALSPPISTVGFCSNAPSLPNLLKSNRIDALETDFQLLLQSDIGVVIVEDDKLEGARRIIAELKGETG